MFLPALPAAAGWERLQPETATPPIIAPVPDAVCREQARRIDERTRRLADTTAAAAGTAALRIPEETWADRRWFVRHCFWPPACPAAEAVRPQSGDGTVTGPYEQLLRLCGLQDGPP